MARKLVTDMKIERFQAWRELLIADRALSHQIGIVAVRPEGAVFRPGVQRNSLQTSRDADYQAMHEHTDGLAFEYPYEASVQPISDNEAAIAPGYYACLMVFDNDVRLSSLRPRIDALMAARQAQTADAIVTPVDTDGSYVAVPPAIPIEVRSGAA